MAWPTIFGNLPAGNQPLSLFDTMFNLVANLVAIPCTAGGSANAITLTGSLANSPPVVAYQNFQPFKFKASATSTGAVSLQFAALPSLPVYRKDGITQCGANDIIINFEYAVIFDQSRNGNTGGFYLEDSAIGASGTQLVSTIAAAATTDLGSVAAQFMFVTGSGSVTSFGASNNLLKILLFQPSGTITLVQGAHMGLPNNGNNITVNNGDTAIFTSDNAAIANWNCIGYQRTNGQALVSGGGGGFAGITPSVQLLTTSQAVTIPTGATKCKVTLVGGGGGGGGATGQNAAGCNPAFGGTGGPGGPAGVLVKYLTVLTAGNTLTLTVGGAGTGASAGGGNNGGNGSDTTLASGTQVITTLTASHGSGGIGSTASAGAPGASGTGTNGDLNFTGGPGISVSDTAAGSSIAGDTGLGFGPGGKQGGAANGQAATGFGGGGSGGVDNGLPATARSGGAGTAGCGVFEWYP